MGAAALPRAIGIVRVSRQNRNEDSRESPEVQRRLITRFAGPQGQGWDLIVILDENELRNGNVSGGGDVFRRLGFSAAIKRIEAGKADLIVVADHGRLFGTSTFSVRRLIELRAPVVSCGPSRAVGSRTRRRTPSWWRT